MSTDKISFASCCAEAASALALCSFQFADGDDANAELESVTVQRVYSDGAAGLSDPR